MSDQATEPKTMQNATRGDFVAQIRRLHYYLGMIAARPLEFNTACRALAMEALEEDQLVEPDGSALIWKDSLDQAQRDKVLRRSSMCGSDRTILPPREGKGMNQGTNEAQAGATAQEPAKAGGVRHWSQEVNVEEIEMLDVTSSNLARIGHDGAKVLLVEFRPPAGYVSGDVWAYQGITPGEFIELFQSESVGKTYNAMTKNRGLQGVKVKEKRIAA